MAIATLMPRTQPGRLGGRTGLPTALLARMASPVPASLQPTSVPVPGISRDIRVKIASTRDEWSRRSSWWRTATRRAATRRPAPTCASRATMHCPTTSVLVAKAGAEVVATFSLVPDNALLGMPLEGLYRDEIRRLRLQGRKMFETGNLADRNLGTREFIQVFLTLMQLGWQHMTRAGADTTVITVNPRHSSFYTRLHSFLTW